MPHNLFLDTNVFLDAYLKRTEKWLYAKAIIELAIDLQVNVFTSASSLLNMIYALNKQPEISRLGMKENLLYTIDFVQIINPETEIFLRATKSGFTDLEDTVQYHTALSHPGMTHFVTFNIKDFKQSSPLLPVCTPAQFVEQYGQSAT